MHIYDNSRWRPPPSLISKIGCYFFTIGPILIKFDGDLKNLLWNAIVQLKMHHYWNLRWRPPPSLISKIDCHFFTMAPILTKFGGNDDNPTYNATVALKMHFTKTKDGGHRHLDFCWICVLEVTFAFGVTFSTFPSNLVRIGPLVKKWQPIFETQDGAGRHL